MAAMRLDKFIAEMGLASRSDARALIKNGRVRVNGETAVSGDLKIDTENTTIFVDGEEVKYRKFVYLMLNKPGGFVCAAEDKSEKTVMDLLDERLKRRKVFSVGRLDKDTEGLLILTDDGDYSHKVISPKSGIIKRYYAKLAGQPDQADVLKMRGGLILGDGTRCLPAELEILSENECVVSVSEGKYHQVKRMMASIKKPVVYLKRLAIGALVLDETLPPGSYRELSEGEIALSLQNEKPIK